MSLISPKQIDWTQSISGSLIPSGTVVFDLGTSESYWNHLYASSASFEGEISSSTIAGIGNVTQYSQSVEHRLTQTEWTGSDHEIRVDRLEAAMSASRRLYVAPSGSDDNLGTQPHIPFRTIKAAVESIAEELGDNFPNALNPKNYTIFVASGDYVEDNPINVPAGVSIVGDTLRTTRLRAQNPKKDFFHVDSACYFFGLRFLDLQYPAFAFSFPCSTAEAFCSGGAVVSTQFIHSYEGYTDGLNQDLGIIVEHADNGPVTGSAEIRANVIGGRITSLNIVDGGEGYTDDEKPWISIPAPTALQPIVVTSPYVQNCSSITGPFDTNGVKVEIAPPYDENNIDGNGLRVDRLGAGGGIRIDGNLVHPSSPLESFVADAFTQVNQGGPGHLVTNRGYSQFVSCFTTFCTYGFKVSNGGFANNSNSVIDFGDVGLVSKTYFPTPFNTASVIESQYSRVSGVIITQDGGGYTNPTASVEFSMPDTVGGIQAEGYATITLLGTVGDVVITNPGQGYTTTPGLIINPPEDPAGVQAVGIPRITGVKDMEIDIEDGLMGVEISSNMIINGTDYLVTNVSGSSGDKRRWVTTFPNPPKIEVGDNVKFHKLSNISTGGLVFEYVGSGVTYNALTKFGGIPDPSKEIFEYEPGRVFYTTIDNIGNLKVGDFFRVDQLTGEITIDANNFTLTGIDSIGPFRRNEVPVGVVLREVSNNSTLENSQGIVGEDTVPTQFAVYTYVNEYTQSANNRLDDLEADVFTINGTDNEVEIIGSSSQFLIDNPVYQIGLPNFVRIGDKLEVPNLNVTNDTLITGSVMISGSLFVNGQTVMQSGLIDSSSLKVYGEVEILNQQLSSSIETAKLTIENLGQLGNRDSSLTLDLGGIF